MQGPWISTPESSNVRGYGYDPSSRELIVEFKGGKRYIYSGVSPQTVKTLATAESVGSFINKVIIPNHQCRKEQE